MLNRERRVACHVQGRGSEQLEILSGRRVEAPSTTELWDTLGSRRRDARQGIEEGADESEVSGIVWQATLVKEGELAGARALAVVAQMSVLVDRAELVVLQSRSGDVVEYCTEVHEVPAYLFSNGPVVTGFVVDNLRAAVRRAQEVGVEVLGGPVDGDVVRYAHVRGPGGSVVGLIERL